MRKLLLLYIVLVFLNACVYKPTAYEMAQADYGQVPDSYEGMIKHKLKQDLPDPHAATIEVSRPYPAVRSLDLKYGGRYEYGHVVHAWIIPKNDSSNVVHMCTIEGNYCLTRFIAQKSSKVFWWSNTGWSTMLPSLEGVTPKYWEQAEEYSGMTFTRH